MKKKQISDYRVRKSVAFTLYDAILREESFITLLATRALYCIIEEKNDSLDILRYVNDEIKRDTISVNYRLKQQSATMFHKDLPKFERFEKHYLESIIGEKLFQKLFFVDDWDFQNQTKYLIFEPILIGLQKNSRIYRLYPVIKVINNETVITEFYYYPIEEILSLSEFIQQKLELFDEIESFRIPAEYFIAQDWPFQHLLAERFDFEGFSTTVYEYDFGEQSVQNLLSVATLFLGMLFEFEEYTYYGRTTIALDINHLTDDEINSIQTGIIRSNFDSIYKQEFQNFSEDTATGLFILPSLTLTTGDILETYIPALVIDEEIAILNQSLLTLSKLHDSDIEVLLQVKKKLQLLKQKILYKYSRLLVVHTVMKYMNQEIFHLEEQINSIDNLIETAIREKEFQKANKANFFATVLGIVSVLLSSTAIFEYITIPIFKVRYGRDMINLEIILNFVITLSIVGILMLILYFISYRGRNSNKNSYS